MATPYDSVPDRRAIIRRRALEEALAHLVEDVPTGAEPAAPQGAGPGARRRWPTGRTEIRRRFEEPGPLKNNGPAVLVATSFLMDQLIRVIFDFAEGKAYPAANPSAAERLGVVATGGFGRGEMAPLSRHRSPVPASLQADAARRADRRVHALPAVGPRAEGRPRHPHGRGEPALRRARPHHPHRAAGDAVHLGRPRALRRADEGLRGEDGDRRRPRFRRGQAHRARPAPHRAWAIRATSSSPTSRRARAGCATCTRSTGSPSISIA